MLRELVVDNLKVTRIQTSDKFTNSMGPALSPMVFIWTKLTQGKNESTNNKL